MTAPPSPRPAAADLERRLLGAPPGLTREEVAAAAGVPLARARRLWRALGFADVGGAAAFTDGDVAALAGVQRLLDDGTVDEDTATDLVRAVGTTMARLADWQAEEVAEAVTRHTAAEAGRSRLATAVELADRLVPEFERLQAYAWRRHLAAAGLRLERLGAEDAEGLEQLAAPLTAGFADLVGFTRLSRRLGAVQLAGLVERFEERAADRVAWHGARLVKTLGDSVLFVATTPRDGVAVALGLVADLTEEPDVPPLRVGVGTGRVLTRFGDVYGEAVNRASRLTSVARRDGVLVDAATAAALEGVPGLRVRRQATRRLRGLGAVPTYAVEPD